MPDLTIKKKRPVWYNLSPVNLPLPGIVSILHRISGILLVLALLWGLYLLDLSLASEDGFRHLAEYMGHPLAKIGALVIFWSFFHHVCAGIRYLLLDVHVGIDLGSARRSSQIVLLVSLAFTLFAGAKLW